MSLRMLQVKSWQSNNTLRKPCTTSTHATAKFLKGMKLITNAEFLLSLYTQTLTRLCQRKNGVLKGICATVKISWEPKYEAVILNFKFIVPRRKPRDTVRKFGKLFKFFDQF